MEVGERHDVEGGGALQERRLRLRRPLHCRRGEHVRLTQPLWATKDNCVFPTGSHCHALCECVCVCVRVSARVCVHAPVRARTCVIRTRVLTLKGMEITAVHLKVAS